MYAFLLYLKEKKGVKNDNIKQIPQPSASIALALPDYKTGTLLLC